MAELEEGATLTVSGVVNAPGLGIFPGGPVNPDIPKAMGLVGVPAWFWADDPGPGIGRAHTVSTTVADYTLAATVIFRKIVYDTGDGILECRNLGDDPGGRIHEPTIPPRGCYHVYEHKGLYHVTATTYFDVEWTGAGQHGVITGLTVQREADYRIGEIQVLIVNP
ncbi:MAG: hypothetical protein LBH76_04655 [Propionibacteriaceae bacterium]|nr:hypothetical protein [Propionibacteriaceae bacterium]